MSSERSATYSRHEVVAKRWERKFAEPKMPEAKVPTTTTFIAAGCKIGNKLLFFFGYKAIYSRGQLAQSGERSLTNPAIRGRFTAKPNA